MKQNHIGNQVYFWKVLPKADSAAEEPTAVATSTSTAKDDAKEDDDGVVYDAMGRKISK